MFGLRFVKGYDSASEKNLYYHSQTACFLVRPPTLLDDRRQLLHLAL